MACEKIEQWINGKNAKHKQCRNFMGKVCCLLFASWGFFQEDYLAIWPFLNVWLFICCYCREYCWRKNSIPDSLADIGFVGLKFDQGLWTPWKLQEGSNIIIYYIYIYTQKTHIYVCMYVYMLILSVSCNSISTFLLAHSPTLPFYHLGKINKTSFKIWSLKTSVIIHTEMNLKSHDHG